MSLGMGQEACARGFCVRLSGVSVLEPGHRSSKTAACVLRYGIAGGHRVGLDAPAATTQI